MATFVLAMMQNPEVQRIAQADIDRVVGGERLPSVEDRDSLPYVTAIVKEALRYTASFRCIHGGLILVQMASGDSSR